jgi:hypothetical protein
MKFTETLALHVRVKSRELAEMNQTMKEAHCAQVGRLVKADPHRQGDGDQQREVAFPGPAAFVWRLSIAFPDLLTVCLYPGGRTLTSDLPRRHFPPSDEPRLGAPPHGCGSLPVSCWSPARALGLPSVIGGPA